MFEVRHSSDRHVELAGTRSLGPRSMKLLVLSLTWCRHGLVDWCNDLPRWREVRLPKAVMSHMGRIHHKLRRRLLVMLRHDLVWGMRVAMVGIRNSMEAGSRDSRMMDRCSVLLMRVLVSGSIINVLRLALLARLRVLARIIHIVPYSIVSRQRASDTWVPPERTALDGRRKLDRKNLTS